MLINNFFALAKKKMIEQTEIISFLFIFINFEIKSNLYLPAEGAISDQHRNSFGAALHG
jgi:hypothetical protein